MGICLLKTQRSAEDLIPATASHPEMHSEMNIPPWEPRPCPQMQQLPAVWVPGVYTHRGGLCGCHTQTAHITPHGRAAPQSGPMGPVGSTPRKIHPLNVVVLQATLWGRAGTCAACSPHHPPCTSKRGGGRYSRAPGAVRARQRVSLTIREESVAHCCGF